MNRKLVATVLALAMVVSLIPILALADGNNQGANSCCCTVGEVSGGAVVSYGTLDELVQSPVMKAQIKKALAEQGIEIKPEKAVWTIQMTPGSYTTDFSTLNNLMWKDFDVFIFILMGSGTWKMEIKDCCIMGDTMKALGRVAGQKVSGQATSPSYITLGPLAGGPFSIGIVITGYTACPGGFPAGYDWYAWYDGLKQVY